MVARTPQKQRKLVAPLNPVLLRETLKKVDKCMERVQELQYTIAGGNKVLSGVSLSPRSTKGYLKTSLRCKQESLRIKNAANRRSPVGKFPATSGGDWRKLSLPAMLLGETMGEILQASQFAREIVEAAAPKKKQTHEQDPKTPETLQKIQRPEAENTCDIKARRKKEKDNTLQLIRKESGSPSLQRASSRVMFKIISPMKLPDKENRSSSRYIANRVSPKHKPWAKKTVLFPNPLFHSTESAQQAKFCRTGSPVIARTNINKSPAKMNNDRHNTPHKFLIKSPVKIKSPPKVHISPTRPAKKLSPKLSTASRLRRSFSPGRLANRLVSPLKNSRKCVVKNDDELISGLKQRPFFVPKRLSTGRT